MTEFLLHTLQPELDISDADAEQLVRDVQKSHPDVWGAALFMLRRGLHKDAVDWLCGYEDKEVRRLGMVLPRLLREMSDQEQEVRTVNNFNIQGNNYGGTATHDDHSHHFGLNAPPAMINTKAAL